MSPEKLSLSEKRKQTLLHHSQEVLSNFSFTHGTQSFILTDSDAERIGHALNQRDHVELRSILQPALVAANDDYRGTEADECIGVWNQTVQTIFGQETTLHNLLEDDNSRELLNMVLTDSHQSQLGMDTTEYLKFVETIAVVSMPDTGYTNYPESRRSRNGGTHRALFNRAASILTHFADNEPGIRGLREDILNEDPEAVSNYLSSLVRAESAQASIEHLVEMDTHDIRRQKLTLESVIKDERSERDTEISELMHVLDWKMLTVSSADREKTHHQIKKVLEGQSKTEFQRRHLRQNWCPERLDFLIEMFEQAIEQDRHPEMYISNRFENGSGVYIAVVMDHVHDATKKMAFADNPLAGNALYIADEVKLANEDRPYTWKDVLGASRRIARERGAVRKYHTQDWQGILQTVIAMGAPTVGPATPEAPSISKNAVRSVDEVIELYAAAVKRLQAVRNKS